MSQQRNGRKKKIRKREKKREHERGCRECPECRLRERHEITSAHPKWWTTLPRVDLRSARLGTIRFPVRQISGNSLDPRADPLSRIRVRTLVTEPLGPPSVLNDRCNLPKWTFRTASAPTRYHFARAAFTRARPRAHFHGDAQCRVRSSWPPSIALSVVDGPVGLDSVGRILAESIPGRVDRTRHAIWQSRSKCNPSSWPPDQPRVNNRARRYGTRGCDAHAMPRTITSFSRGCTQHRYHNPQSFQRWWTFRGFSYFFLFLSLSLYPRFTPFFARDHNARPTSSRCSGGCAIRTECTTAWKPRGCERWSGVWLENLQCLIVLQIITIFSSTVSKFDCYQK